MTCLCLEAMKLKFKIVLTFQLFSLSFNTFLFIYFVDISAVNTDNVG